MPITIITFVVVIAIKIIMVIIMGVALMVGLIIKPVPDATMIIVVILIFDGGKIAIHIVHNVLIQEYLIVILAKLAIIDGL